MDGDWVVTSASWCGRSLPFTAAEKLRMRLVFKGKSFKDKLGRGQDGSTEGTYELDRTKSPTHLDLNYTKGEVLAIRKCLFMMEGSKIKIAFSIPFAPGTPEQELKRAKEMFATRPNSFDSAQGESTLVLVLERRKK